MGALKDLSKMSTGRLILVGVIGTVWLLALMLIVAGTAAILTSRLPGLKKRPEKMLTASEE